jgi:GNAT superfamily N-acetyltransferase
MSSFAIRQAKAGDAALVVKLLYELADYEKLLDKFTITEAIVTRDYFCEPPLLQCDIAYDGQTPIGIATWYWTYSSFAARRGIFLEDLFVRPSARGNGYGKALLVHLARTAVAAGGGHVEWEVLDWNKPSIDFYESLGAKRGQGWFDYKLSDDALKDLAQ